MRTVGPYEVLGEIGRGGVGAVLRARAPGGRVVAVKVLLRRDARRALERFERERRLLASLSAEDGFVPLLDAGDSPAGPYLVMPLVTGGSLRQRLAHGPLGVEETRALGLALARALARAHALGVVHRDVKPENVLFDGDRPLLSDLGLAKHFRADVTGASRSVQISRTGEFGGTPGYAAPEQAHDLRAVGPAADVFSLGAVLYECLEGRAPFEGESAIETLTRAAAGTFDPIARRDAPAWLVAAIARALAVEPGDRFADGAAFAAFLASPGPSSRGGARRLAAALVVVAALAAAAVVLVPRPTPQAPPRAAPGPAFEGAVPVARAPDLPAQCRKFLRSNRTRLVAVRGTYDGKHAEAVSSVALTADGKLCASASLDHTAKVWDPRTGRELLAVVSDDAVPTRVSLSPGGEELAIGYSDGRIHVQSLREDRPGSFSLAAHEGPVRDVCRAGDDGQLLSCGEDGRVLLWRLADRSCLADVKLPAPGLVVRPTPDGRGALAGCRDGSIHAVSFAEGRVRYSTRVHRDGVTGVAFTPRESIVTASLDGYLIAGAPTEDDAPVAHAGGVECLAVLPDGTIASGGDDRLLKLWSPSGAQLLRAIAGHTGNVNALALTGDGRAALTASGDQTIALWDLATGARRWPRRGPRARLNGIVAGPREEWLAVAGAEQAVALTSADGSRETLLDATSSWITCLAAAEGRILTGEFDGTVRAWEPPRKGGVVLARFERPVGRVALDGARAFALHGGEVVALDAKTGAVLWTAPDASAVAAGGGRVCVGTPAGEVLAGPGDAPPARRVAAGPGRVLALDVAPDGAVASAHEQGAVVLGPADGSRAARTIGTHAAPAHSVTLSPGGERIATASFDRTIRLWDGSGELDRIDLTGSADYATQVRFVAGGRRLLATTARGVTLEFEVER